ncbi:MAG: hypothetical protein A2284_10785 [Deltaproteobacteria bacterium RIFOXYA12_FULL_61_11]|nr:MAG: hypothetical protein A2284_10785 [Deltaproteobacteria bacterium RIFOXYA12_FULL_61_11]
MNLRDYLTEAAQRHDEKTYLHYYGQPTSYREFARRVFALANGLTSLGIGKGEVVHVLAQNDPAVLVSYFAIQAIGAIAGPINTFWKAPEVQYLLGDSGGTAIIVDRQFLPLVEQIQPACPALRTVIVLGAEPVSGHASYERLLERAAPAPEVPLGPEDLAFIFYTSGTTGNPKGVLLSHRNVLADLNGIGAALHVEDSATMLVFLPLFHVNAMLTSIFGMRSGIEVVLRQRFSASEFWEVVAEHKVNFWSAVPAVYQILLSDPGRQQHDLSSLRFGICGAAPLTAETMRRFEETFGIPIVEGYGLTEGTCVSTINPRDGVRKVGSIGLPLPGQEVEIFDPEDRILPVGQRGELAIRGENVMVGYHGRPEDTAATLAGGWLHTGDVGYKDEDGYVYLVDRIKDMIIRGGENIYPKEVDNCLAGHPKVQEAATIGVPDPVRGEEVKVFIVPSDESLTEEEVLAFCRERLADYKVPRYVELLDQDLPRNPVGKVLKKVLREWGLVPRPKKPRTEVPNAAHVFETMPTRIDPKGAAGLTATYGYRLTGPGGGEWTVAVAKGKVVVTPGLGATDVTVTMTARDFLDLNLGTLDGMTAFTSGKIKAEGNVSLLLKATKVFTKYRPREAAEARTDGTPAPVTPLPAASPSPPPGATVAHVFATLPGRAKADRLAGVSMRLGYDLTGEGGGRWTVNIAAGKVTVTEGLDRPEVTTIVSAADFLDLNLGKLDGMTAFTTGRIKVEGDASLVAKSARLFSRYRPPEAPGAAQPPPELLVLRQVLSIDQRFDTGPLMGKFLAELRDHQRILANRCPRCGRLQTPPREACAVCRVRATELVEVGPEGTVGNYDLVYYASPDPLTGESRETPYCTAFILLDGCRGNDVFWHELDCSDLSRIRKGARVRPVWAEHRTGAITDLVHFTFVD